MANVIVCSADLLVCYMQVYICYISSMHVQSYRRSRGVHFHNIGLAGVNEMENKGGWKMLTLAGAMKYLGHEDVINAISKLSMDFGLNIRTNKSRQISAFFLKGWGC